MRFASDYQNVFNEISTGTVIRNGLTGTPNVCFHDILKRLNQGRSVKEFKKFGMKSVNVHTSLRKITTTY